MLRTLAVAALAAASLAAQVTVVPGTGCAQSTTFVQGTPAVGQTIQIVNPFFCLFQYAIVAVGTPTLVPWLNCSAQSCAIGVAPVDAALSVGTVTYNLAIPNNPALVGFCFRAQSACMTATCLAPDRAVQICVQ